MLIVREFKITYRLKEPNSVSMYIEHAVDILQGKRTISV